MSYIVTKKYTRPSTDVSWYFGAPLHTVEYQTWLGENWVSTGKISLDFTESPDRLTLTVVNTLPDEATWNDLTSQQQHIDYQALKTAWNDQNGITQTTTFKTV